MNHQKVETFAGQVVLDLAASMSSVMTGLGTKLGLYKAMAGAGPLTPAQLAARTNTHERYITEWLNNQAAGGYINFHSENGAYELPDEHAAVLAWEDSPAYMGAATHVTEAMWRSEERIANAFRDGSGIGWGEHHHCLHVGTEKFFRTGYKANLTTQWIPALEGVEARLQAGAVVADVGCGHGASTVIMAEAFPKSTFWGFDFHDPSIQTARRRAEEAGVAHRTRFEVATAKTYPARAFDLICFMDCLHDLGDPLGAAVHARRTIAPDGTVLLVEPRAGDTVQANLNPVGRLFYAASTAFCTPNAMSQERKAVLGAQAGEARFRSLLQEAGFSRVRRAAETPFNIVIEARP